MKKLRTYDNDDYDNDEQIKPCYCYFNSLPVLKKKKRFKNQIKKKKKKKENTTLQDSDSRFNLIYASKKGSKCSTTSSK